MEYKKLNNGVEMPMIGLGVYNIHERETQRVVEEAFPNEYHLTKITIKRESL